MVKVMVVIPPTVADVSAISKSLRYQDGWKAGVSSVSCCIGEDFLFSFREIIVE
jgi:hypothetical protein